MTKKLSPKSLKKLEAIEKTVLDYKQIGYRLTLKQLYYQLVSQGIIPNNKYEYREFRKFVKNALGCGLIDFYSTEEDIFVPGYLDVQSAKLHSPSTFVEDRHLSGKVHIELWCEKKELFNMLYKIAQFYKINLVVNSDLMLDSIIYDACERIQKAGKPCIILYVGDYHLTRPHISQDIKDSFSYFDLFEPDVNVQKIALTVEQILNYKLPLNPTKIMNLRANTYAESFEGMSVEVEALKPNVLDVLIRISIETADSEFYEYSIEEKHQEGELGGF